MPSELQVEYWAAAHNLGVVTGRKSRLLVIDDDTEDGSAAKKLGLPPCPTMITGSEKLHHYLRYPDGVEIRNSAGSVLGEGIDVRGEGGQIVFAGSVHPTTGEQYRWAEGLSIDDLEPPEIPEELLTKLLQSKQTKSAPAQAPRGAPKASEGIPMPSSPQPKYLEPYCSKALENAVQAVANTPESRRNDELNRQAFCIGQLVGAGGLELERCRSALHAAASQAGLDDDEIAKTLESGLSSGIRQPRDLEPIKNAKRERDRARRLSGQKREAGAEPPGLPDGQPTGERPSLGLDDSRKQVFVSVYIPGGESGPVDPLLVYRETVEGLVEQNDPEELFIRGGNLVRIRNSGDSSLLVELMGKDAIKRELLDRIQFMAAGEKGIKCIPPPGHLIDCMAGDRRLPFSVLDGTATSPVVRPDGSILTTPGYDHASRLFYQPPPGLVVCVPEEPSEQDQQLAIDLLREPFLDFPFRDRASGANALALLITPFIAFSIDDVSPLCLIDAEQHGSGKSLLAGVASNISTGTGPRLISPDLRNDEELDKQLTAALFSSAPVILLDNCKKRLESAVLEAFLTALRWSRRVLGYNTRFIDVVQRAAMVATGNNLQVGSEIARRSYLVTLDTKCAAPEQRTGFRHPNLIRWVKDNRSRLVSAVLVLIRAWFVAGRPSANLPAFGSYDAWSETVGGILAHAGVVGFLENRDKLRDFSDVEREQWKRFLRALQKRLRPEGETAKSIAALCVVGGSLEELVPEELAEKLDRTWSGSRFVSSLFRKRLGRRVASDGLRIEQGPDEARLKVKRWKVVIDA